MAKCFIYIFLILFETVLFAQEQHCLTVPLGERVKLDELTRYTSDASLDSDPSAVLHSEQIQWRPFSQNLPSVFENQGWYRWDFCYSGDEIDVSFDINYNYLLEVQQFLYEDNILVKEQQYRKTLPLVNKGLFARTNIDFAIKPKKIYTVLLKVKSYSLIQVFPVLERKSVGEGRYLQNVIFKSIYMGVIFAILIFTLFMLIANKSRILILYLLNLVILQILTMMEVNGYYSIGSFLSYNNFLRYLTLLYMAIFIPHLLFARVVNLRSASLLMKTKKLVTLLYLTSAIIYFAYAFSLNLYFLIAINIWTEVCFLIALYWIFLGMKSNVKESTIFLIGWLPLGIFGILFAAQSLYLHGFDFRPLLLIGSAWEALIFLGLVTFWIKRDRLNLELLKDKSKSYSQFMQSLQHIAHDLKKPLNQIKTVLNLFESNQKSMDKLLKNPEVKRSIILSLNHAEAIVEDIVDSDQESASFQKISFKEYLQEFKKRYLVEASGVIIEKKQEDIFLYGNKNLLQRLFDNLLNNALEEIDESQCVEIEWESKGQSIAVRISNPINQNHTLEMDKIFLPYYSSNKENGTGLGLAAAKRIAEYHGGSIGCCLEGGQFISEVTLNRTASED